MTGRRPAALGRTKKPVRSVKAVVGAAGAATSRPGFLATTFGQVASATVGLAVASVAGWLSPIGDAISDALWQEDIAMDGRFPAREKQLQDLQVILQPQTRAGISGGVLSVRSLDNSIEFIGATQIVVPPSAGAISVPDAGRLRIRPLTAGTHDIGTTFTSKRGEKFAGILKVVVEGISYEDYVGREVDWNGKWRISLNRVDGSMTLRENRNRNISGSAEMTDGRKFAIDPSSWHDGTTFLLILTSSTERYELRGMPCLVSGEGGRWRILNGKAKGFDQGRPMADGAPISSIVERCDDMRSKLAEVEGNGSFEARITLN